MPKGDKIHEKDLVGELHPDTYELEHVSTITSYDIYELDKDGIVLTGKAKGKKTEHLFHKYAMNNVIYTQGWVYVIRDAKEKLEMMPDFA
jgi:hypothetical protein